MLIRNKYQHVWIFFNGSYTDFLGIEVIKDIHHGSFCLALLYISWVFNWSGTKRNIHLFISTAFSHIFCVLCLLVINFNNIGSLSMAWINISCSSRDDSKAVTSKKLVFFIHIFQSPTSISIWRGRTFC